MSSLGVADRFWAKVQKSETGCWLWTGTISKNGYGNFGLDGRVVSAHRMAWQLAHGRTPPAGAVVMHSCDVRACVRPDHLSVGSHKDNMRDMVVKGRSFVGVGSLGSRAKLSETDAESIRREYQSGGVSHGQLSEKYGLAKSAICRLLLGQTYPTADGPINTAPSIGRAKWRPRLDMATAQEMRRRFALGTSVRELAALYSVSISAAGNIVGNRTYVQATPQAATTDGAA